MSGGRAGSERGQCGGGRRTGTNSLGLSANLKPAVAMSWPVTKCWAAVEEALVAERSCRRKVLSQKALVVGSSWNRLRQRAPDAVAITCRQCLRHRRRQKSQKCACAEMCVRRCRAAGDGIEILPLLRPSRPPWKICSQVKDLTALRHFSQTSKRPFFASTRLAPRASRPRPVMLCSPHVPSHRAAQAEEGRPCLPD
jgi:hypothetical protein